MSKKILSCFLLGLMLNITFCSIALAQTNSDKDLKRVAKVKSRVEKIKKYQDKVDEAYSVVKLLDGSKVKGIISEIRDGDFIIAEEKTGKSTQISYSQVKRVGATTPTTKEHITTLALGAFAIFGLIIYARH